MWMGTLRLPVATAEGCDEVDSLKEAESLLFSGLRGDSDPACLNKVAWYACPWQLAASAWMFTTNVSSLPELMLTERLLRLVLKDGKMPKGKATPTHLLCHSSQAGLPGGKRFFIRAAPGDFRSG